jgi:V8-like Glu-specific endopeptidase
LLKFDIGRKNPATATGFLVDSNLVLTAAHNLFCNTDTLHMEKVHFFPGLRDVADNSKGYKVIDYRFNEKYHSAYLNLFLKDKD